MNVFNCAAAALVGLLGIATGVITLRRGVWLDEFITLAWTTPETSTSEFLDLMTTREIHPILHYGMVYLLRATGESDIVVLRSMNLLLGLPLIVSALAFGVCRKSINLSQAIIVWVLFLSSPIFFEYFAELRAYFLVYAASIATCIVWYVLMSQIDQEKKPSAAMILIWFVSLGIFANLHYFATIFGAILCVTLLIRLPLRHWWLQVLGVAGASLIAEAPALLLGVLQIFFSPLQRMTSWIKTSPTESLKISFQLIENATAWNLVVIASAVVTFLHILKSREKRLELRSAVMLLGIALLFLVLIVILNGITPVIVYRYLFAAAGAITFSVAMFAATSGTPFWVPLGASVIALFLQAQTLRSSPSISEGHGWLPSARAVTELLSECPTTKILVHPVATYLSGGADRDAAISQRIIAASYGYYAKEFHFSYDIFWPGRAVELSGPCPTVIWIENAWRFLRENPDASVEHALTTFRINQKGSAELKRFDSGILIILR